ncbi:MAG: tetratricopeptide repeat protein [Alphaproteobacteria bacterium]|nr:tetratricopeptide repeat protein [Alphaproteobacteria bacterium]
MPGNIAFMFLFREMMMRTFSIFILVILSISVVGKEESVIDSLETELLKAEGKERIIILKRLVSQYTVSDSVKSFRYFIESVNLSEKLNQYYDESNSFECLVDKLKDEQAMGRLGHALAFFVKKNNQPGIGFSYSFMGSRYLAMNNYVQVERYQNMALELFTRIGHPYGIALANERLGILFMVRNQFIKALDYYYRALKINQKEGFKREEARSLYHIGLTELYLGNYQEATTHILLSLKYWELSDYIPNIWNCNELLGNIYIKLNVFDKSLYYHRRALKIRFNAIDRYIPRGQPVPPGNLLGIAYSYNNIAEVYLNLNQYDSAYFYAIRSLIIKEAKNSVATRNDLANSWLNMGNIYRKLDKPDSALFMLTKAAKTYKELQNGSSYAESLYGIGNVYSDLNNFNKAQENFKQGLQKSIEVGDKNNIKTGYKRLSDLYRDHREYEKSLDYYLLYSGVKDSIFNKERSNAIEELQIKYEVDKKEQKIESQALIIRQKKEQITYVILGSGILVVLASLIIFLIIKNKRQKEALLKKEADNLRKDLELKNRELVCNVSNIYTKNMVINKVAKTLSKSIQTSSQTNVELINEIIRELQRNMDETSWKEFEYRFSKVHESFYETLDMEFPELTHSERKICAMLKLDLSSKEIAAITMTQPESVDTTRSRIRKKLGLLKDENLSDFLKKI